MPEKKIFKGLESIPAALEDLENHKPLLSPEMQESFDFLLNNAQKNSGTFIKCNVNWELFQSYFKSLVPTSKKVLLETRRAWIAMRKNGDAFNQYLTDRLEKSIANDDIYEAYRLFDVYTSLHGATNPEFVANLLGRHNIWTAYDGSIVSSIMESLVASHEPNVVPQILAYIENMFSPEYARAGFLDGDLWQAVSALISIVGEDEARKLLDQQAEKSTTLEKWLGYQKFSASSGYDHLELLPEFRLDEFDLSIETYRLIELENQIKESEYDEGVGPSHLDDDYDNFFPPISSPYRRAERPSDYTPEVEPNLDDYHSTSHEVSERAIGEASRWENGKLLNLYGRFKPRIENPVQIDSRNYIRSILSVVGETEASTNPEDYLGIINGVVGRKDDAADLREIPAIKSIRDAHRIAAVCFARSLSVALLENKVAEAIAEVGLATDFIEANTKGLDAGLEVEFIASLISELRELAESLTATAEMFRKNSMTLPESANPFMMAHPWLKKAHQIADFRTLLAEKIKWYLANDLAHNMASVEMTYARPDRYDTRVSWVVTKGPSLDRLKKILAIHSDAVSTYRSVEEHDMPVYWEAAEALDESFRSKRNVVFGRDGRYFFTALKALKFGQKDSKQIYLVISTPIKDSAVKNPIGYETPTGVEIRKRNREKVIKYLQENGVTLDSNFIDTGYSGSIPEFVIGCLSDAVDVKLSSSEIDSRIKLMSSTIETREQITRRSNQFAIEMIEERPKNIGRPNCLVIGPNGKIGPEIRPYSVESQILAWVVEHVSLRNFAPRLDANKRIHYNRENPLEGYHFLQNASGQGFISTHPMELWVDDAGNKVLLKGGPEHTVRADFVGHQFFRKFGLLSPESKLVKVEGGLKIKMEFMEKYESGGISLPDQHKNSEDIQRGLLIDALLGQYDRTPWNIMFKRAEEGDGPPVAFIDHGASLDSRARGGFKAFPNSFKIRDLEFILANPQFPGTPVNEAYTNFIEVKNGVIIVHNKPLLRELLQKLKEEITNEFIDSVIYEAGYPQGQASTRHLRPILEQLDAEMREYGTDTNSPEYKQAKDTWTTYKNAIDWGGEAAYFGRALKERRNDILDLLTPLSW